MSDVADRLKSLGITTELVYTRDFRFLEKADQTVLQTIRCGVLFVMAFWSGPARKAFAELKRILAEADPEGRLDLVVVDIDGCSDLWNLPEFLGNVHGAGETAWVKDGCVVATSGLGFHPERFVLNTMALLVQSRA